ncbi:MAG: Ku protein [Alphaproteobacteria bacterium]|nr:Ku protein [Alphaproteobacteria bacterium]
MAERPIWRGHLRLALVTCPIALYTARRESGNLHFNLINPETGNRIRMLTVDSETEKQVSRRELVKGYEFKKGNYLLLSDEDFESARIESSSTLNVNKFVPVDSIDPLYFESSYYLVPDGETGQDVYVVLREAIRRAKKMALSRVVIARRERAVALMPVGRGLVAHTLHEQRDIVDAKPLFDRIPEVKPDEEMVKLAMQLVERQTAEFDPADMEDRYEARLRDLIEAKLRGQGIEPEQPEEPDRSNVIDLMSALKRSLDNVGAPAKGGKASPAKSAPAKESGRAAARKPAAKSPARKRA